MKGKKDKRQDLNPEDQLKKLAIRLKDLRHDAGYKSLEFFAIDHRMSPAQYGRYEKGQDLRFTTLVRLANAHGLTLAELLTFDD